MKTSKKFLSYSKFNDLFYSLFLGLASFINFFNFIFIPKLVGLSTIDVFYEENLYASTLNLMISPVIPYFSKTKSYNLFFFTLIFYVIVLLPFSNTLLLIGNLIWVVFGLINMNVFFAGEKLSFIIYTVLHSTLFLILTIMFRDYILSFLITGIISLTLISIVKSKFLPSFKLKTLLGLKNYDIKKLVPILRPIFSISSVFLLVGFYVESYHRSNLVEYNYYIKITNSISVALLSYFALDAYRLMKLDFKRVKNLSVVLIFTVFISTVVVNFLFDEIKLNYLITLILALLSIVPLLTYNIIVDDLVFKFFFLSLLVLTALISYYLLNDFNEVLVSIVLYMFLINIICLAALKKNLNNGQ